MLICGNHPLELVTGFYNTGMKHRNVLIYVFWPVNETGTTDLQCFILFSLIILPIPLGGKFIVFSRKTVLNGGDSADFSEK